MAEAEHPFLGKAAGETSGENEDAAHSVCEEGKAVESTTVAPEPEAAGLPEGAEEAVPCKGKQNETSNTPAQGHGSGSSKRVSAYFNFAKQNRETVKARLISAGKKPSASDIGKALGELWKTMTDEEKCAFKQPSGIANFEDGGEDGNQVSVDEPAGRQDENGEPSSCQRGMESDPAVLQDDGKLDQQGACQEANEDAEESVEPNAEEATVAGEAEQAPFPLARVKRIIKLDPDIRLVSISGVTAIARATELFLEALASSTFSVMVGSKRKSVRPEDICSAIKTDRRYRDCIGTSLQCMESGGSSEDDNGDTEGHDHAISKSKKVKKSLPPPAGSRCITDCFKKINA